jgi:ABC-type phosphate/phosphonate transport system substrate-binding protein
VKRAILIAAAAGLMGAAPQPPFRIGVIQPAAGPCAPPPVSAPAGERAYFDLLAKRLDRAVLACPVASFAEGAVGLATGALDMTVLDEASYPSIKASVRAMMTVRLEGGVTRVPVVLAVKAGRDASPQALKGRTIVFAGASPVAFGLPKEVLSEQGYGGGLFAHELVMEDEVSALAAVRSGKADAVALEAAAWQRQCRGGASKDQPCADLKLAWRARPQAHRAFAVRRDMPDPFRFRLLGVHVAMSLENRPAFAWAASQLFAGAADFQPAEIQALEAARLP